MIHGIIKINDTNCTFPAGKLFRPKNEVCGVYCLDTKQSVLEGKCYLSWPLLKNRYILPSQSNGLHYYFKRIFSSQRSKEKERVGKKAQNLRRSSFI